MPSLAMSLLFLGCAPSWVEDSGRSSAPEADADTDADTDADADADDPVLDECEEIRTKINGRYAEDVEDPNVGDKWIIRMYCDGAVLLGANHLNIQPASLAEIDPVNTDAVFISSGSGTMRMQAGSFIYNREITVGEAPR